MARTPHPIRINSAARIAASARIRGLRTAALSSGDVDLGPHVRCGPRRARDVT
jgi:hypothetical protein